MGDIEDGGQCPNHGCIGKLFFPSVENCSCHINPPCSACVNNPLTCNVCGFSEDVRLKRQDDRQFVPTVFGTRPLDASKIDYRIKAHSSCSQICEGVYPNGTTMADVRAVVDGTFGGRFVSFGGGKFKFIAYTD